MTGEPPRCSALSSHIKLMLYVQEMLGRMLKIQKNAQKNLRGALPRPPPVLPPWTPILQVVC